MKKSTKNTYIYIIMITVFSLLIYLSLKTGIGLHKLSTVTSVSDNSGVGGMLSSMVKNNLAEPLMTLLMQIIIILITCKIFSSIFNYTELSQVNIHSSCDI